LPLAWATTSWKRMSKLDGPGRPVGGGLRSSCSCVSARTVQDRRRAVAAPTTCVHQQLTHVESVRDLRSRSWSCNGGRCPSSSNEAAADWPARAIEFDILFHDVVAQQRQLRGSAPRFQRYRLLVRAFGRITGGQLKNLQDSFQEHLAILRALEKRDPKARAKPWRCMWSSGCESGAGEVYHARPAPMAGRSLVPGAGQPKPK